MSKSAFRCLVNKSFLPKPFHLSSVLSVSAETDVYPRTAVLPQQLVKVKVLFNQFEDACVLLTASLIDVGCLSCLVL